jgi:hypothetical protein
MLVTGERIFWYPTGITTMTNRAVLQHITIVIIWTGPERNDTQLKLS